MQLFRLSGDNVTFVLALSAAMSSAAFASYMWIVNPSEVSEGRLILKDLPSLSTAEQGRTGVRPIAPTIGENAREAVADPITTASTARAREDLPDDPTVTPDGQTQSLPGRLTRFELLGVYGDTALVGSAEPNSQEVWPVKIGTQIPGAGRVIKILPGEPEDTVFSTKGFIAATTAAAQ